MGAASLLPRYDEPMSDPPAISDRLPGLWIQALLVVLAACIAYGPTLGFELVWDDLLLADSVSGAVAQGGIGGLLTAEFNLGLPTGYYRPLVLLSLHLDSLAGIPLHHATNCALHAACSVLVMLLIRSLLGGRSGPLVGGLLFAVHPVHTESVAFVSGRTDLMAGLFMLLATLFWVRIRRRASGHPGRDMVLLALAYFAALASKELALLLPAVLVVWDLILPLPEGEDRFDLGRVGRWLAAMVLALVLYLAVRFAVAGVPFGSPPELAGAGGVPWSTFGWLTIPSLLVVYLRLLVVPWPLNSYYTPDQVAMTATSLVAACALLGLCVLLSRRRHGRVGLLALSWILGFLLPVSGVVAIAGAAAAERFLYVPSIGVCLLVGYLVEAAVSGGSRTARMVTVLACAVVLSVAAAASLKRSLTWQDPRSLFESMIETSPKAWVAHLGLANELVSSGHYDEAERHFVEVLRLHPADADTVSSSHHNLGVLYQIRGDHHRAVAAFRSAIAARPQSWQAYRSMAASYRYLGLVDEAAQAEKRAREILHGQPDR
jgi:hypothetical protein